MTDVKTANKDISLLAPKFAAAIKLAIAECAANNIPVKINEGFRSQARQSYLYSLGRTVKGDKVTNAPTSLTSWHGYGLAIDFIHETKAYWPAGKDKQFNKANEAWFHNAAQIFKKHGCSWGGDWTKADTPHIQWGKCTASPTAGAKSLMQSRGAQAVWEALEAIDTAGSPGIVALNSTVSWLTYQGVAINKLGTGSAYSFVTNHVALDADGSPLAYHPGNTGLDLNANAGYPDGGWKSVLVVDPADTTKPFVQPNGYFVSKTSLQDDSLPATDPRRYVDSETVPYIVFPGAFYAIKGTGSWGDLAMVRNLKTGNQSAAIIADGGPTNAPLGEMSLQLAEALGGTNPNPRNGAGAPSGQIQYVVFPGSRKKPAWRRSQSEIDATALALLSAIGGWPKPPEP